MSALRIASAPARASRHRASPGITAALQFIAEIKEAALACGPEYVRCAARLSIGRQPRCRPPRRLQPALHTWPVCSSRPRPLASSLASGVQAHRPASGGFQGSLSFCLPVCSLADLQLAKSGAFRSPAPELVQKVARPVPRPRHRSVDCGAVLEAALAR